MQPSITDIMTRPIQRIPPDGGYGWAIVISYAIANLIVIPTITSFGLIFKDKFAEMNVPAADLTFIINLNAAFAMSLGFLNGPLLRTFGYRKISVIAAVFFAVGLTMTAFATTVIDFIITYGLITAVGYGLSNSSFTLALNSYFRERRNKAAGIAMTLTGIGPILYPPLIDYLLTAYGVTGCMLLVAGLALNMLVAAAMLQPIEWHLISVVEDQEMTLMGKSTTAQLTHGHSSGIHMRMPTVTSLSSIGRYDSFIFPEFPKVSSRFDFSSEEEVNSYMERCPTKTQLVLDHDIDVQSIYGFDQLAPVRDRAALLPDQTSIARNFSRRTLCQNSFILPSRTATPLESVRSCSQTFGSTQTQNGSLTQTQPTTPNKLRWFESGSLDSIHLGSSAEIFKEPPPVSVSSTKRRKSSIFTPFRRQSLIMQVLKKNILSSTSEKAEHDEEMHRERRGSVASKTELDERAVEQKQLTETIPKESEPTACQSLGNWLIRLFDLDLLRDKIYLNMMLGMSIAIFAEMNFAALTPFILNDLGYTNGEIAGILSIIASADIIARFISPFVADYFACSVRATFIVSLLLMMIFRTGILFVTSYTGMVIVVIAMGIAKGVRTVYMSLVIPSYIPIERLASASGLQMFTNGIFMLALGPVLGLIKDWTGNYSYCIIFLNMVSLITIVMYTTEMFYNRNKVDDDSDGDDDNDDDGNKIETTS